ncbi:BLUF domain-containing protein, partial [Escherichia sp. SP-MK2]
MLTTLIYRSHIRDDEPVKKIEEMVSIANRRNMQSDVTGILLFNGSHFFQLLEGPEEQVKMIYRAICQDPRQGSRNRLIVRLQGQKYEKIVALCH